MDQRVLRGARFSGPTDGEDLAPVFREVVERFGPDYKPEPILAFWAEHPSFRYAHPDIEWTIEVPGLSQTARGPTEIALLWADWGSTWERYVYSVAEHRDLGDWVLQIADLSARGRDGIAVDMRTFELFQVRDEKIVAWRMFLSELDALKAVDLEE